MLVREEEKDGAVVVRSKAIFRDVHESEKQRVQALYRRFPGTFTSNCSMCNKRKCTMRIEYDVDGSKRINCAYISFWFEDISLEDAKDILVLYRIENKIK